MDHGRAGRWGVPNERYPMLPGRYGELCFRYIQGNCVLGFFDVDRYCCSRSDRGQAHRLLAGGQPGATTRTGSPTPQLYGGYISPDSQLNKPNGMKFLVTQWNTASNDPYHVVAFDDTLAAQGKIAVPEPLPTPVPEPEPLPQPEPPDLVVPPRPTPEPPEPPPPLPTDPQELYELLLTRAVGLRVHRDRHPRGGHADHARGHRADLRQGAHLAPARRQAAPPDERRRPAGPRAQ